MVSIRREALEFMLGASRELYPKEFIGLLRGEGDTVTEVIVVPASLYGEGFAQVRWMHVPIDKSIIGSVHSHPTGNNKPSKTDLMYFSKSGRIHFIIKHPHQTINDIACYHHDGTPQKLKPMD